MPCTIDPKKVEALRDERGRRRPHLAVQTEAQALDFVNQVGFCFTFAAKGFAMPTLFEAISGESRAVPMHHDDPAVGKTWDWKDTLPTRKACFYGKVLRKTPTLVSLAFLPYFYALSPNCGSEDDYLEEYQDGHLSIEARWVYEALLENGAQPTSYLRKQARLDGKSNASRFDRAITELQAGLKITKVGISDANAWGYCYVYDILLRQYPDIAEQAREIPTTQSEDTLCLKYLETAVCASTGEVTRLFGWEPWRVERLVARLTASGQVTAEVHWPKQRGTFLARTADLSRLAHNCGVSCERRAASAAPATS